MANTISHFRVCSRLPVLAGLLVAWAATSVAQLPTSLATPPATPSTPFLQIDSTITDNSAILSAPQVYGADTIVAVWFHVRYSVVDSTGRAEIRRDTVFALDTLPPFEAIWDCRDVPDQDDAHLLFYADAILQDGTVKGGPGMFGRRSMLLRTARTQPKSRECEYRSGPMAFDGRLDDWAAITPEEFTVGNNHVSYRTRWNDHLLCFGIEVTDSSVIAVDTAFQRGGLSDAIEVLLDPRNDRSTRRNSDDFRVVIGARGAVTVDASLVDTTYRPLVAARRTLTGYVVEIGITWNVLGLAPSRDATLGFCVLNADLDNDARMVLGTSASGSSMLLSRCPASWDTLILRHRGFPWMWVVVALLVAGAGVALWRMFPRKRRKPRALASRESYSITLQYVIDYLEEHCADSNLDIHTVAANFYMTGPALNRTIRGETRMDFRTFLAVYRIGKAQTMLGTTDTPISEVAKKVGFATVGQFSSAFQKMLGVSPVHFRNRARRGLTN